MQRTENLKLVQELNSSIILKMIRHHVLISRSEIAKKNKIRLTTVTSVIKKLLQQGLVHEDGVGISCEIFMAKELKFYLEHNWQSAVFKKLFLKSQLHFSPATFLKEHENNSITVSKNVLCKLYKLTADTH